MPSRIGIVNYLPRPVICVRLSESLQILFIAIKAFLTERSHPLVGIDHNVVIWNAARHSQRFEKGFDGELRERLAGLLLNDLIQMVIIIPVVLETVPRLPACGVSDE